MTMFNFWLEVEILIMKHTLSQWTNKPNPNTSCHFSPATESSKTMVVWKLVVGIICFLFAASFLCGNTLKVVVLIIHILDKEYTSLQNMHRLSGLHCMSLNLVLSLKAFLHWKRMNQNSQDEQFSKCEPHLAGMSYKRHSFKNAIQMLRICCEHIKWFLHIPSVLALKYNSNAVVTQ